MVQPSKVSKEDQLQEYIKQQFNITLTKTDAFKTVTEGNGPMKETDINKLINESSIDEVSEEGTHLRSHFKIP